MCFQKGETKTMRETIFDVLAKAFEYCTTLVMVSLYQKKTLANHRIVVFF